MTEGESEDPQGQMGPLLVNLPPKQQAFVIARLEHGPKCPASRCAAIAGYQAENLAQLERTAYKLMHDPRIIAATVEETRRRMEANVALGALTVIEIAGELNHKDRYKAATRLLDQAGLGIIHEQKVTVVKTLDRREQIRDLIALARDMNMDPATLLGQCGDITDADFVVIDQELRPDTQADPATLLAAPAMTGREGLEDIL